MKFKQSPDDFRVVEVPSVAAGGEGPFMLYRLEKRGWTTPDALAVVRRRWKIDARRVSFGGLKDRQAQTVQHFTILHGPARDLKHGPITVSHLGKLDAPFTSAHIGGNRFQIVLRDLTPSEAVETASRFTRLSTTGFPNYFDDQRFGSFLHGEFVGRLMVLGDYEAALKLATDDRKGIEDHLRRRPGDFQGAIERIRPDLQGVYLGAYQSFIWNRMLAEGISRHEQHAAACSSGPVPDVDRQRPQSRAATRVADATGSPITTVHTKVGDWPVPKNGSAAFHGLTLPLPSARLRPDPKAVWWPWLEMALEGQGHTLARMKLPGLRKPFFSKGERPAWAVPRDLRCETDADDLSPGRMKTTLSFELPRGSYATMLIKCLGSAILAASDEPVE